MTIQELMDKYALTVTDLSIMMEVSETAIGYYLKGVNSPRIGKALLIYKELGIAIYPYCKEGLQRELDLKNRDKWIKKGK